MASAYLSTPATRRPISRTITCGGQAAAARGEIVRTACWQWAAISTWPWAASRSFPHTARHSGRAVPRQVVEHAEGPTPGGGAYVYTPALAAYPMFDTFDNRT